MKLITEMVEDLHFIKEEAGADKPKQYFVEGIIMQGDVVNRNGRMYPKKTLFNEAKRYREVYIENNRAYGELGHPKGPTINLDRVSHYFVELREEGSNIVGKAKIMDTPKGKIVKSFIDEGVSLGISSRGVGSMKKNPKGYSEVQEDFTLATAGDIVSDPSAPEAFLRGVMENAEWYYDEVSRTWQSKQILDEVRNTAKKDLKKLDEKRLLSAFNRFLKSI